MEYNDHAPQHFHARYGAERATIAVRALPLVPIAPLE